MKPQMNVDERGLPATRDSGRGSSWCRLTARFVRALSDLLAASEPKRKRPRNLYIKGMTAKELVTRPHNE